MNYCLYSLEKYAITENICFIILCFRGICVYQTQILVIYLFNGIFSENFVSRIKEIKIKAKKICVGKEFFFYFLTSFKTPNLNMPVHARQSIF